MLIFVLNSNIHRKNETLRRTSEGERGRVEVVHEERERDSFNVREEPFRVIDSAALSWLCS